MSIVFSRQSGIIPIGNLCEHLGNTCPTSRRLLLGESALRGKKKSHKSPLRVSIVVNSDRETLYMIFFSFSFRNHLAVRQFNGISRDLPMCFYPVCRSQVAQVTLRKLRTLVNWIAPEWTEDFFWYSRRSRIHCEFPYFHKARSRERFPTTWLCYADYRVFLPRGNLRSQRSIRPQKRRRKRK